MYRLTNEDVLHVADLAKLHMFESDIEKYKVELEEIINNINYIESIDIEDNIMISPSNNSSVFSNKEYTTKVDVLLNVKNKAGEFIKVEVEDE